MSPYRDTVVVVRRNLCERDSRASVWRNHTLLQVAGLSKHNREALSAHMHHYNYRIVCTCGSCIVFEEEVHNAIQSEVSEMCAKIGVAALTGEPMIRGVQRIFSELHRGGFKLKSSSSLQNGDGSTSTVWVFEDEDPRCRLLPPAIAILPEPPHLVHTKAAPYSA